MSWLSRCRCGTGPGHPVLSDLAICLAEVYGGATHVVSWAATRFQEFRPRRWENEDSEEDDNRASRQRCHDTSDAFEERYAAVLAEWDRKRGKTMTLQLDDERMGQLSELMRGTGVTRLEANRDRR